MIQTDSQIVQSFSVIVHLDRVQVSTASCSFFRVLAPGIHNRYHYGRMSGLSRYGTAPSFCSELTMPIRVFDVILALWIMERINQTTDHIMYLMCVYAFAPKVLCSKSEAAGNW